MLWSFTLRSFQCRLWSLFSVGSSQVVYVYSRGLLRKASVNSPVRGTSQLLFARQIRLTLRHFPEGRLSVIHELQQCGTSRTGSVWQSARLRLRVCTLALDKWSKSYIVHSIRTLWLSYYPVNAEAVWIGSVDMIFWLNKHQTRALHPSAAKPRRDTVELICSNTAVSICTRTPSSPTTIDWDYDSRALGIYLFQWDYWLKLSNTKSIVKWPSCIFARLFCNLSLTQSHLAGFSADVPSHLMTHNKYTIIQLIWFLGVE